MVSLHVMNLKPPLLHRRICLMAMHMACAGARNRRRRLKTSPDGGTVRVCEGSGSGQAPLRIALAEPRPVARKPACHAAAGSKTTSQNRTRWGLGRRSWVHVGLPGWNCSHSGEFCESGRCSHVHLHALDSTCDFWDVGSGPSSCNEVRLRPKRFMA